MPSEQVGPHGAVPVGTERERFTLRLFDSLWERYCERVPHVAAYERVIAAAGGAFVNDHIAFRTIARQQPFTGIASISRIFEALGYRAAGVYHFEDKHLSATHFQHPHRDFPKLFLSELKSWELSAVARQILERALSSHRLPLEEQELAQLAHAERLDDRLLGIIRGQFEELPWNPPEQQDVLALNAESQYAAWVLVHGYRVNHFTALVNSHGTAALDDIEKTVAALREAGVPMKGEIEGAPGSKLRQTATEASQVDVAVRDHGRSAVMTWPYAYFELAERGEATDPETGHRSRFDGFLGPQATHLFEMTRSR